MAEPPFGAVLAGGESSRYGSPKALARVGGRRIVDRVVSTLRAVVPDIIVSANDPGLFRDLGLPIHPDERPGLGPLAGIYTTLLRAREAGRPGILAVACDMPFPSSELLALLAFTAFGEPHAEGAAPGHGPDQRPGPDPDQHLGPDPGPDPDPPDIVLPESPGPRGVEPLFAAYRTTCIPAIEAALAEGDRRMIGFHERVRVRTIPLRVVESLCTPSVAFLNVNTPADRARAEAIAAEPGGRPGRAADAQGAIESRQEGEE